MDYKVAYITKWSEDGTTYRQMITITLTEEQLAQLNKSRTELYDNCNAKQVKTTADLNVVMYLKDNFAFGDNYCTNTMLRFFLTEKGISGRVKLDRNTMIRIKKKKTP